VWAVGHGGTSSASTTLVEHWDGTSWNLNQVASVGTSSSLLSVTATSPPTPGAAGFTETATGLATFNNGTNGTATLIEHWNGTAWTVVPSP
jgi:hypothetical protein